MARLARLAASALALGATPALAVSTTTTTAADYNLFVLRDLVMTGNSVAGGVAVGGNATMAPYTVGSTAKSGSADLVVRGNLTMRGGGAGGRVLVGGNATIANVGLGAALPQDAVNLAVGGDLDFSSGSINGRYTVGGRTTLSGAGAGAATRAPATLPVDFAAEATRLSNLARTLAGRAGTAAKVTDWSGNGSSIELDLIGSDPTLNVFTLTAAQLGAFNSFRLKITPGSVALINVTGDAAKFGSGGMSYTGATADSVLFNFADATALSVGNVGVLGSILAPNATFTGMGGNVTGQVIVGSFGQSSAWGGTTINAGRFAGDLLRPAASPAAVGAVPEPGTWATMILGFAIVGLAARRRRPTARVQTE